MAMLRAGTILFLLAALAAATSGIATAGPGTGFARGDRAFAIDSVGWPWAAIGRVNLAGKGFCTGTLVAPDVVLTAAHCLFEHGTKRPFQAHELTFLSGYQRGEALGTSRGRSVHIAPGFVETSPRTVERVANDWALVRLVDPLPMPPIAVHPLAPDLTSAMLTAGYGQNRAHMLTVHDGCKIASRVAGDRVLVHNCDVARGGSGSPLLTRDAHGYTLIGIVVGNITNDAMHTSLGVHAAAFAAALAGMEAQGS